MMVVADATPLRYRLAGHPGTPTYAGACPVAALRLGAGERDAIVLAQTLRADLLVMDNWDGREAATQRGLTALGTLGVLDVAASRGLVVLPDALARLQATNFRMPPAVVEMLLARDAARHRPDEPPTQH